MHSSKSESKIQEIGYEISKLACKLFGFYLKRDSLLKPTVFAVLVLPTTGAVTVIGPVNVDAGSIIFTRIINTFVCI